jgi:hypothetical protein
MLEKINRTDKVEVVGPYRHVQVRNVTEIKEDGKVISSAFSRHVIAPTDDYGSEDAWVQGVCDSVFTQDIKDAYTASLSAANP